MIEIDRMDSDLNNQSLITIINSEKVISYFKKNYTI